MAAGIHTVVLTLADSTTCFFDYIHAVVPGDVQDPAETYPSLNAAYDFDTQQTYALSPARALWVTQRVGFRGDIDFYAGVFFALKRVRFGGSFHAATITLSGTFSTGSAFGDGDAVFVDLGGTTLGAAVYPADTLDTLAQRLVNGINATFVGVCATLTGTTGQLTITTLSPIYGFTLSVYLSSGATGPVTVTGDVSAGKKGAWQVDASQASPLNRAFVDYLADFAALVQAAGKTMTVAFSQELLGPPDENTAGGAWGPAVRQRQPGPDRHRLRKLGGRVCRCHQRLQPQHHSADRSWRPREQGEVGNRPKRTQAVVTDVEWIKQTMRFFSFLMPGTLRLFPTSEATQAREWITAKT